MEISLNFEKYYSVLEKLTSWGIAKWSITCLVFKGKGLNHTQPDTSVRVLLRTGQHVSHKPLRGHLGLSKGTGIRACVVCYGSKGTWENCPGTPQRLSHYHGVGKRISQEDDILK